MSTLAERQRELLGAIFDAGEAPAPAGIYRRNVLANLRGALAATYPVVARLVGGAFFDEAARLHAIDTASTSGDLNEYGAAFAQFLERYPHARGLTYLADVARLEWACHESLDAADAAPFDFAALAAVAPARHGALRFRTHPSVRLLRSPHPIASIWHANQPGRDGTPERAEGEECVLVRRDENGLHVESLDPDTWRLIGLLAAGATLGDAAAETRGAREDFLATALARLVADRILVGFDAASA